MPIVSAREVNGIEEAIDDGQFALNDGILVFNIGHYQPKTFAIRLEPLQAGLPDNSEVAISSSQQIPYNLDVMSYDNARGSASYTYTYAYPAELIPDTLVADGIRFAMGPREGTEKNVLKLSTPQTISLSRQSDDNKLYLLLATPSEAGAKVTVTVAGKQTVLDVPCFTGRAAEPPSCTTLAENYRKQDIVFASSHAHHVKDKANQTMQMLYIYKYGIELPEDVSEFTIKASDLKTFLFAATTATCHYDDIEAFAPLTTEIESSMVNGQWSMDSRLEPKSVTASHYINSNEAPRYANDQDPTTKWCVGSSQSQTPWLQYILKDTAVVERWMVLGAARESGNYVARAFKLQYMAEDGTWVDADLVEDNQVNKVIRTLKQPVTTTRVRLQMIQGEWDAYTTRIYEFAVYGYLKKDDPVGIVSPLGETEEGAAIYDLIGRRQNGTLPRGIYVKKGKKFIISR